MSMPCFRGKIQLLRVDEQAMPPESTLRRLVG